MSRNFPYFNFKLTVPVSVEKFKVHYNRRLHCFILRFNLNHKKQEEVWGDPEYFEIKKKIDRYEDQKNNFFFIEDLKTAHFGFNSKQFRVMKKRAQEIRKNLLNQAEARRQEIIEQYKKIITA